MAGDGSRWKQAHWEGQEVTIREHNTKSKWISTELMILEMESLAVLRHPNILLLMATCCGPMRQDLLLVIEPVKTFSLFQLLHGQFEDSVIFSHTSRIDVACGMIKGQSLCGGGAYFMCIYVHYCIFQPYATYIMWLE